MPPNPEFIHNPSEMGDDVYERNRNIIDMDDSDVVETDFNEFIEYARGLGLPENIAREHYRRAAENIAMQNIGHNHPDSSARQPHSPPSAPPTNPPPREPSPASSQTPSSDTDATNRVISAHEDPALNQHRREFKPEISSAQRREATKMAENMIREMEREERERLIQRSLDSAGFLGALFFRGRHVDKVTKEGNFLITPEIRQLIEEYCLREVTGQMITRSGDEVRRLMHQFGFEMNARGEFDPPHQQVGFDARYPGDSAARILNRIKPTGGNFLFGMGLGYATRAAITGIFGGLGGAVGGGILTGGIFGFLRGRREGTESFYSGEAWLNEVNAGLNSGTEAQIELACHKVEMILGNEEQREQFFRNRTRMEAARLLERYREGIRRLALIRMTNEVTDREFNGTEEQRQAFLAQRYAQYCGEMASGGEQQLMYHYGNEYCNALAREVGIISSEQNPPDLQPDDRPAREQVQLSYTNDLNEKQQRYRALVIRATVVGALTGGIAGGLGWYVGHLVSGAIGVQPGSTGIGPDGHHYGTFTNEYSLSHDAFTPESAEAHGLGHLIYDPRCPIRIEDGQLFVGTDQGAALSEATKLWSDQLNFHGMDQNHVYDLMHLAGSHINQLPVSPEYGYTTSLEQIQAGIDHIATTGDHGIFDFSEVFTRDGIKEAVTTIAAPDYAYPVPNPWPGWLYVVGGAGFGAGSVYDAMKRSAEIKATQNRAKGLGAGRGRVEGPYGQDIINAGAAYNQAQAARQEAEAQERTRREAETQTGGGNRNGGARNQGGQPAPEPAPVPEPAPTPPPVPENPPNEDEPPEVNFEDIDYPSPTELPSLDGLSLAELIEAVSNNQETNSAALAIENLIDTDDEVYSRLEGMTTELQRLHELENRLNSLGNDQGHQLNRNWITAQSVRLLEAWNNQRRARRILNAATTLSDSLPEGDRANTLAEIQQANQNQIEQAEQGLVIEDLLDGNDEIFEQLQQIGFGTPERRADQITTLAERLYNHRIANNYIVDGVDPNDDQALAEWDWERANEIIDNLEIINRLEIIQQNANSLAQLI